MHATAAPATVAPYLMAARALAPNAVRYFVPWRLRGFA